MYNTTTLFTTTSVSSNIDKSSKATKSKGSKAEKKAAKRRSQKEHDRIMFGVSESLGISMIIHNNSSTASNTYNADQATIKK